MNRQFQTTIINDQKSKILFQMTELALSESASLISSMGHSKVRFTLDSIVMDDNESLLDPDQPEMIAVCHRLDGASPGHILFLTEQPQGLMFTKKVLNEKDQLKNMSELEEEALTEIGNIIINNFLSHYVQVLHESVSTMIPTLKYGHYAQLIDDLTGNPDKKELYVVKFNIEISTQNFFAFILWIDHLCQLQTTQT